MPYGRRYKKKKGRYFGKKKGRYFGKRTKRLGARYKSTRSMAYKGWQMAIRQEKKHNTHHQASIIPLTTAQVIKSPYNLGIVQGVNTAHRIGKQIRLHGIKIDFTIQSNAGTLARRSRLIIGYWDGSTLPSVSNILATGPLTNATYSPYSTTNAGKYQILYDRVFTLVGDSTSPYYVYNVAKYISFKGLNQVFVSTAASFPENNQPFIMYVSDDSSNGPAIEWQVRSYWTDN